MKRLKPEKLIFLYNNKNRYSINALLGAIETEEINIDILLSKTITEIKEIIKDGKSINLIAISFTTDISQKIYSDIKGINKTNNILLAGGAHPSAKPKEAIENGFDYVFCSESEDSFNDFLKFILNGKFPEEKIIMPKKTVDLNRYHAFSKKFMRFGPIEITRGCPYACKFCQTSFLFGANIRHRGIAQICYQVKEMAKIGLDDIRFITPNCMSYGSRDGKNLDLKAVEEMLYFVKKSQNKNGRIFFGTFPSEIRPEHINDETLNLIKNYCFNKQITIGVQTASNRLLKQIHRGHDIETVRMAIKTCLKNNFIPILDFIFGLPNETENDINETINFIDELSKSGAIIHTHSFSPLPGTPFSNEKTNSIPERLKLKIKHLENRKLAFGKWERDIN
jgi:B12-binding domain/radical SAM domain protein